jgi:hypothetical protein
MTGGKWRAKPADWTSVSIELPALSTLPLHNLKVLGLRPFPQSGLAGLVFVSVPALRQSAAFQLVLETSISSALREVAPNLVVRTAYLARRRTR